MKSLETSLTIMNKMYRGQSIFDWQKGVLVNISIFIHIVIITLWNKTVSFASKQIQPESLIRKHYIRITDCVSFFILFIHSLLLVFLLEFIQGRTSGNEYANKHYVQLKAAHFIGREKLRRKNTKGGEWILCRITRYVSV